MISFIKGIITKFTNQTGRSQKFDATGHIDETFKDREAFGQYGLASSIPEGAEAVIIKSGQNVYLIASDDRRYRIATDNGEVALYTMYGENIVLKKDHSIEINATGAGKVIVNAMSVYLGGELLADGVVTGLCSCSYTGGPHPVKSTKVKAQM